LLVHGPGAAAADFGRLPFRHLPQPLFPFQDATGPIAD
jgi:microcystin degradation protein MlrC